MTILVKKLFVFFMAASTGMFGVSAAELIGSRERTQEDAVRQADEPVESERASAEPAEKIAFLVRVELPIDGRSGANTQQAIQNILDDNNELFRAENRPTVVLEFGMSRGATGQGSSIGACIDLAEYLTSPELSRVKTVAYLSGRTRLGDMDQDAGSLNGHAVLVALAANQLAINPDVKIGAAGIDEPNVDSYVAEAYNNMVAKRLGIPVPMAMAMLDKSRMLFRVRTDNGPVYGDEEKLKALEQQGVSRGSDTLSDQNQLAQFSGQQLQDFGLIRSLTPTRVDLARQLGVSLDALKMELNQGVPWVAVRVEMPDYVDKTSVQWITRALEPKLSSGEANLVVFDFDSTSGDIDSCLLLARRVARYGSKNIRTVAYVDDEAAGPAALIALSCYHVIIVKDGQIGGDFLPRIPDTKLKNIRTAAAGIAETIGRDAALVQAMIDPDLEVVRFRNKQTGEERILTDEIRMELVDADKWLPQSPLDFSEPINAATAEKLQIARQIVSSIDELNSFYQLENEPELLKPTTVDRWLNQAALFFASPFVAPWLLFLAMFFIFNEVSQPGLGVPGFLGTLCLILYFWSQHLDGNAHWLEILLFVAGALFLLIEIFVLPGFGLFGIGGLIMVVSSIVLASQTFILPSTTEQFNQLPKSLFALAGACGGVIFAMVALRTILPNTPYFKKIMLEPPAESEDEFGEGTEGLAVDRRYLIGRPGIAITNLAPSGKARIEGQLMDVITEGRLIEKNSTISVIEVAGNRVVVGMRS